MPLSTEAAARKDRTTPPARMEHRHFATNPNFDRARFLRACGATPEADA